MPVLKNLTSSLSLPNKSGGIVFVSHSVKSLLGYTPNELLKEGWWDSDLREAWISRDYIINYPNIVPGDFFNNERVATLARTGRKSGSIGKIAILPNGNYMGVAFNITKYKK